MPLTICALCKPEGAGKEEHREQGSKEEEEEEKKYLLALNLWKVDKKE